MVKQSFQHPLSAHEFLFSSASVGVATAALTNPLWLVKTRVLASGNTTRSIVKDIRLNEKVIPVLWRGFTPGLFGVAQSALQFMTYEKFKMLMGSDLNTFDYIALSGSSKALAALLTYPYQVIRARMQTTKVTYGTTISARSVVSNLVRNEGFFALYRGLSTNLARVIPASCITFVVWEKVGNWARSTT